MDFAEFIRPELLVLVPVLYAVGAMLKKIKTIKDKYIPIILTLVSLALALLYVIGTDGLSTLSLFTAIVQAVLCAATAVYTNQLFKQSKED